MSTSSDIVCMAFPSWEGEYSKSSIELMKALAANYRILYIDYAFTWKDVLLGNKNAPIDRVLGKKNPLQTVTLENGSQIHVLSLPPSLPANWAKSYSLYQNIMKLNTRFALKRIRKAMKQLNMHAPIIVNAFNPAMGLHCLNKFNEKATIYYCYDNMDATLWANKHAATCEKDFTKKVQATVFTSHALKQQKSVAGTPSYLLPNGVNLTIFEPHFAAEALSFAKPTIGYVGMIDDRLDYELLSYIIKKKPEWHFQFIGKVVCKEANQLSQFPNVTFEGAKPAAELPAFMKQWQAGIIPFRKNEFTQTIFPMKANEYLVMGLPVVKTNFAALSDLDGITTTSNSPEDFHTALQNELTNDHATKRLERHQFALNNSWKARAATLEKILIQYAK